MKSFLIISFILNWLVFINGYIVTYLTFHINRDYIAANLCVQKDIPDNCCKGSCQLDEMLSQDDDKSVQEKSELRNRLERTEIQLTAIIPDIRKTINDVETSRIFFCFIGNLQNNDNPPDTPPPRNA